MTDPAIAGATHDWAAAGVGFVSTTALNAVAALRVTRTFRTSPSTHTKPALFVDEAQLTLADCNSFGPQSFINFAFDLIQILSIPRLTFQAHPLRVLPEPH